MLTPRQIHCLQGMGITLWRDRTNSELRSSTAPLHDDIDQELIPETKPSAPVVSEQKRAVRPSHPPPEHSLAAAPQSFDVSSWDPLLASIEACRNCELAASCTHKVPGKGYRQAELMIIGEAPGRDEDMQGLPFVGRAGQLLDKMLAAIGLDPNQVYITNILKCRPPNNRDPRPEEVQACSQFLKAQIDMIKPRVIFSIGRISAQNLLHDASPVGRLRGSRHYLPGTDIPLRVTYHPAYLLRNPAEKAKVWEDLKGLRQLLHDERN